jgi:hypothetical protein
MSSNERGKTRTTGNKLANTTILLNGFSIIGNAQTNTNASNGGELMIKSGEKVFESDDIVVLQVENANADGSLNDDSIITGIVVYDNATDYYYDTLLYTYSTLPGTSVDVSDGRNGMGDTYLQFDASLLTSTDPDAPVVEHLTIVAGVDVLSALANSRGPYKVATIQDIDVDTDGIPEAVGDGFFSADVNGLAAVCFACGTLIETPYGLLPVEALRKGGLVNTLDNGPQPIRWIGSMRVDGSGSNAPICISRGALGNLRDLLVSPNHRMLVRGPEAQLLFGLTEAFVAAKHLVNGNTIQQVPMQYIEYFHFMTDEHDVVFAEGCPAETLYPGPQSLSAVEPDTRDEILTLFPKLSEIGNDSALCRPELRAFEARALLKWA